jgi:hypothetical protein
MKFTNGQRVTLTHAQYGQITGTVHVLGNANPYIPLGFTHLTLGKGLERAGWKITDGWQGSDRSRIIAILDGWDTETYEANQGALVDAVRAVLDPSSAQGGTT